MAVSRTRLDKLWDTYTGDLLQRRVDGCKELHIATRWSVYDIIGRLQRAHQNDVKWRFVAVPDIDPETGESNFNYKYGVGFSTKYFLDLKEVMDPVTNACLFEQKPIEREGLLYHPDSLRRYSTLPEGDPDAIIAVCDTKDKGSDYMFMPVCYQYGYDYYLVDCICDDSADYDVQYNRLSELLIKHKVQRCQFEHNSGGGRVMDTVAKMCEGKISCGFTSKFTNTNKETRIIVNSEWVKKHVLFRSEEGYARQSDYGRMIDFLTTWSHMGKNLHDDVPDGMAIFAAFVADAGGEEAEILPSFF